jgi:hypothetical protein
MPVHYLKAGLGWGGTPRLAIQLSFSTLHLVPPVCSPPDGPAAPQRRLILPVNVLFAKVSMVTKIYECCLNMESRLPFTIKIDHQKNRLYVKLVGLLGGEEMLEGSRQTIKAMESLKPGFTIITDISECRPLSQEGFQEIRRVAETGLKLGMRISARVVGPSTITRLQFKRMSREAGYDSYNAASLEEAEAMLDGVIDPDAPTT